MSSINHQAAFNKLFEQSQNSTEEKLDITMWGQLTKKMSQLIAKSWLPGGEPIKKILLYGQEEEIKDLLEQNGISLPKGAISIRLSVNWDSFYGSVQEKTLGRERFWEWTIAYPPRPYYDVTDEQLQKWVDNDDPNTLYPTAAYIPLTF